MRTIGLILLLALSAGCEKKDSSRKERVNEVYVDKFVGLSLDDVQSLFGSAVSIDEYGYVECETNGITVLIEFAPATNGCQRVTHDIQYANGTRL